MTRLTEKDGGICVVQTVLRGQREVDSERENRRGAETPVAYLRVSLTMMKAWEMGSKRRKRLVTNKQRPSGDSYCLSFTYLRLSWKPSLLR